MSELEDKSELIAEELRMMLRTEELFKGVCVCVNVCRDGWMDNWMDGRMHLCL